jgi:hypothetical protein
MSKVIKLRLGARQARTLWWLMKSTTEVTEDEHVRATCQRVLKQLDLVKSVAPEPRQKA